MKFYPVCGETAETSDLKEEYAAARRFGAVRLGETVLFFRAGLKTCFIPYAAVKCCFRRVYEVPIKLCCGVGGIDDEHLVISDGKRELADIVLPGTKAAREMMRLLMEKMPDADFRSPRERKAAEAGNDGQTGSI